jgi:hypothetical protein
MFENITDAKSIARTRGRYGDLPVQSVLLWGVGPFFFRKKKGPTLKFPQTHPAALY